MIEKEKDPIESETRESERQTQNKTKKTHTRKRSSVDKSAAYFELCTVNVSSVDIAIGAHRTH